MTSAIDPTLPVTGAPTTASVRDNFQHAKDEIEALQTSVTALQTAPTLYVPMQPGGSMTIVGSSGVGAPNRVRTATVWLPRMLLTGFRVYVSAPGLPSHRVGVGLYYAATGSLVGRSTGAPVGSGVQTISLQSPVAIPAGRYVFAWTASSDTPTLGTHGSGPSYVGMDPSWGYAANASVDGTPPTSLGAITQDIVPATPWFAAIGS